MVVTKCSHVKDGIGKLWRQVPARDIVLDKLVLSSHIQRNHQPLPTQVERQGPKLRDDAESLACVRGGVVRVHVIDAHRLQRQIQQS